MKSRLSRCYMEFVRLFDSGTHIQITCEEACIWQQFLSAMACYVLQSRKIIGPARRDVQSHMSHDVMDDISHPGFWEKAGTLPLSPGEFWHVMELSIRKHKIRFHLGKPITIFAIKLKNLAHRKIHTPFVLCLLRCRNLCFKWMQWKHEQGQPPPSFIP